MSRIYIGISGWRYPGLRGSFYPKGFPQKREIEYASRNFPSIELNGAFYSLQRPSSYRSWHGETPDDFLFSVKASRFITHSRRLRDVEAPLANFFASGLLLLKEKLGPLLWQFPPSFRYDSELLDGFLGMLPHDTNAAAKLGKSHDERLSEERAWTSADANRPIRHAVEIRHESFLDASFMRLLRKHNIALFFSDAAGHWPYAEDVTADFLYIRLHGAEERYVSGYTEESLDEWSKRILAWSGGSEPSEAKKIASLKPPGKRDRDVFVYFDNDAKVKAPENARSLMSRLGVSAPGDIPRAAR